MYFFVANILKIMDKDTHGLPVTRMGKGMVKNFYPCASMGKLTGKIFFHG